MRENRSYGSEGGGTETNQSSLPLSIAQPAEIVAGNIGSGILIRRKSRATELVAP